MPILVALSGTNFSVYPVLCLPSCHSTPLEVWFARVESQFGTKQITVDKPKFDYVVSSLDSTTAGEVEAILIAPPNDKYDVLKAALLAALGKAQAQKDSELTSITGHGDMNTSALLRRLQSLNSDPKTLFRAHFLALLPSEVRSILVGQEITDISDLAKAADVEHGSTSGTKESTHICFYHVHYGRHYCGRSGSYSHCSSKRQV